ncbi:MAG: IPExxxVDY family protein [Bacteroidales bacterium]|nr:IPExxxVDY family protein [Bacteroidales bacterium]MDD4217238.1 IPExxxVDY family protein [Bacteroidales bacterium]MDY0140840.1 IPExxxVDY family protein [Bacteroidales bacterium]
MKTKKVKYTPDYNFKLIGISSTEDDYKLSWKLGKMLKTEFVRAKSLQIIDAKYTEYQIFSVFENEDKNKFPDIRLITNKGNEGFLIEELKNIDFFIIVHYDEATENFDKELISTLKKEEGITAVFSLEPSKLKSKEKLLF